LHYDLHSLYLNIASNFYKESIVKKIAILGAGIAGLVAAERLSRIFKNIVVLLEELDQLKTVTCRVA